MHSCDSMLMRFPLGGVSAQTYDIRWNGKISKIVNIISRIAIIVFAALMIANLLPSTYACPLIAILAPTTFLFFMFGSSNERRVSEILFEFVIASVCFILAILLAVNVLTYAQSGIGIVVTILGAVVLGIPADRGKFYQIQLEQQGYQNTPTLENFEKLKSPLPVRPLDYLVGMTRDGLVSIISMLSSITHRQNYEDVIGEEDTKGLCILIYGLGSRPSIFDEYHDSLSKKEKNITIFQPYITKNGGCSLKTAEANIREKVKS